MENFEFKEAVPVEESKRAQKYVIRDSESGIVLDMFGSEEEAKEAVRSYETTDKEEGFYVEGAYEITEE